MARLALWLDRATQALNVTGTLLTVALMVLIGSDVVGRNVFGAPIAGVPEMVSLCIVAIVFLQAPQALRAGRFTRSEALLEALRARGPRAARMLEAGFDALALAVMGVLLWAVWPLFLQAWTRGTFVGATGHFTAPIWPVRLVICVGLAALIAQFAARLVRGPYAKAQP